MHNTDFSEAMVKKNSSLTLVPPIYNFFTWEIAGDIKNLSNPMSFILEHL